MCSSDLFMARTATSNGSASAKDDAVTTDDVRAQLATLQNDIAALTKTVSDYGRAAGDDAKATAVRKAEDMRLRADSMREDAEAQLKSGYAQAETAVRDNPAAAVGIAAGVGFVLGLLSTRR